MSREFKVRDKTTQKMTKDGLVEHNTSTGEDTRISKRVSDIDLKNSTKKDGTIPRSGENHTTTKNSNRRQAAGQSKDKVIEKSVQRKSESIPETKQSLNNTKTATKPPAEQYYPVRRSKESPLRFDDTAQTASPINGIEAKKQHNKQSNMRGQQELKSEAVNFKKIHTADVNSSLVKTPDISATPEAAVKSSTITKPKSAFKTSKGRLKFVKEEAAPVKPKRKQAAAIRKMEKAERRVEQSMNKLEKAYNKLPSQRVARSKGNAKSKRVTLKGKLKFEQTPTQRVGKLKPLKSIKPIKAAANTGIAYAHKKIFQVENENVGIKAAHRAEMAVEGGTRMALRFIKKAPYRRVKKLERLMKKRQIKFAYRRSAVQNPRAHRNVLSRALQKRRIRKGYAKALKQSRKAAKKAKQAGSFATRVGKAIIGAIRRHPVATLIIGLLAIIMVQFISISNTAGNFAGGTVTSIVLTTYLAEDADMLGAEAAYSGMEAGLQNMLDNYETLNPGYDEYVYDLESIWHDPYVLISILSALHEAEWTLSQVQGTLAMLFDKQYILTEEVTVEIRTKIETEKVIVKKIDPDTGDEYEEEEEVEVEVEYEYKIMTVTLENFDLSHVPVYIMNQEQLSRYAMLMMTLGNRPDLFPVDQYPNASIDLDYLRYEIPPEYFGDAKFAEIIKEAEKYLGYPYVWGGSHPSTSFDCSGFVSWVYNQSGWNFGRLTANGLYGICTPISTANAKPGDLVFFKGTYKTPDPNAASHVGIYVGDGMMLHAGKPIGYASINTPYYQKHFYSFGRP